MSQSAVHLIGRHLSAAKYYLHPAGEEEAAGEETLIGLIVSKLVGG